jgi:hypothetical protein
MTSWGVGERGVARMYGCAPLLFCRHWFQVWPRLGVSGGRTTGATSTRQGGTPVKRANPWNPVNLHTFPHQPCDAGHLSLDCDPSSPAACQRRRADDLAAAKGIRNEKDPAGTGG